MASLHRYTFLWLSLALASILARKGNSDSVQLGLKFTSEPQDVVVLRGEPYVYDCSAVSLDDGTGRPANITWRKDGQTINDARHIVLQNGSLYFTRIVRKKHGSDEGFYECLAHNSGGTIVSRTAHLIVAALERQEGGRTVAAVEGELVRLECNMNAVPATTVSWQKDRRDLPQDPRYTLLPSNTLQIEGVIETDSGHYRCNVANIAGTKFSREDELLVERPKGPPGKKPPDMLVQPNHIRTKVGENETLECAASGLPMPNLRWTFLNDDPIDFDDPKYVIIGRGNLQIRNIEASDATMYKCTATSPTDPSQTVSTTTNLIVFEPPRIIDQTHSIQRRLSDTVRIFCKFSGNPQPAVTWYHNGNILEHRTAENNLQLITYADKSHEGYYQCRAKNDAGQVTTTMRLKVTQSELAPPRNVRAEVLSPTSLKVTWDPVPLKNGQRAMGYSVHYANVDIPGKELQQVVPKNSFILDSLPPYANISIYVIAYASTNTSPHSDTIYQITGESTPIAAPKPSVIPIGATSLKVTWEPLPMNQARGKITEYEIQYRVKDASTVLAERVQGNTYEHTLPGLEPNKAYEVRVLAGTRRGFPDLTDKEWPWITAFTNTQLEVLEPPILQVHALNSTSVMARWRLVNEKQQRSITGYTLRVYNKDNAIIRQNIFLATMRNATITGLQPDTLYKISILCVGGIGSHEKVEPTVREVKTLALGEPVVSTSAPPPPQELHVTPINSSVVRLTWKRPKFTPGISFYTIRYRAVHMDNTKAEPNATTIKHVVTNDNETLERYITGLSYYTLAEFSIRTHTHNSHGAYSYVVRCRTGEGKPSAPRNLQLTLLNPSLAELSWQPPEKRNGIIVQYIINYKENDEADHWMIKTENGSVTMTHVDNLALNAEYLFRLRAKTIAGEGPVTQVQRLVTRSGIGKEDKHQTELPGEQKEQRTNIIIGVSIACLCIIILVLIIVCRFCVPRTAVARNRPGSGTPPDSNLPVHFNGTYMPNANGNRYIGNATGMPMSESHELDTLTPPLVENENSDSKGGYGLVNGTLRVQCMPNGRIATFIDNQDSHVKIPQANKTPPMGNGTNNSSAGLAVGRPDISRNDPPMQFSSPGHQNDSSGSNHDQGDTDPGCSGSSSLDRTSTSSQSQASKTAPALATTTTGRQPARPDSTSELAAQEPHPQNTNNTPSRSSHDRQQQQQQQQKPLPTSETTTVNASCRQDCEEGEGDLDTGVEESEASCLLSHHQEPSALPQSSNTTHHHGPLREHASSPPQSRLADSAHNLPSDADTSGTPLLSESLPDDSHHYSKHGSPTHGAPSSTSSHA